MRYSRLVCFLVAISFLLSCAQQDGSRIRGTVQLPDGVSPDSVYVGLYHFGPGDGRDMGEPLQFLALNKLDFSFNVDPGKYRISAYTYNTEAYRGGLYVPNESTEMVLDIKLTPLGIDGEVESVAVTGTFADWSPAKSITMTKDGDYWILENPEVLKENDRYAFYVNGKTKRHDPELPKEVMSRRWNDFNHYYKGGEIRFYPQHYGNIYQKPTAEIAGSELQQPFVEVMEKLYQLNENTQKQIPQVLRVKPEDWDESLMAKWDSMGSAFHKQLDDLSERYPHFEQLVLEARLNFFELFHPYFREMRKLRQNGRPDSLSLASIYSGETYRDYFMTLVNYSGQFDPASYLLEGYFGNRLTGLDYAYKYAPALFEENGFQERHFQNFILEFAEKTNNRNCAANLLFMASYGLSRNDPEKAEEVLTRLITDYADNPNVQAGYAERQLKDLKIREGNAAPEFAIKTLAGDSLRLSDLRGKFVFLDFWGTWCGPCVAETPHLKKLDKAFSKESFLLIGMAEDKLDPLTNYIEKENIEYPNALLSDDIMNEYGINKFPTTYLIAPNGKIIAKDLRGEKLVELVQEKMDKYRQVSSL